MNDDPLVALAQPLLVEAFSMGTLACGARLEVLESTVEVYIDAAMFGATKAA